jgi:hypothetical protein
LWKEFDKAENRVCFQMKGYRIEGQVNGTENARWNW